MEAKVAPTSQQFSPREWSHFDAHLGCQNSVVLNVSDVAYVYNFYSLMLHLWELMLPSERVLQYKIEISSFIIVSRELCPLELADEEWDGITLVMGWLQYFRDATTEMSAMKWPMLSHTHPIFCGLQDSIHQALWDLSSETYPKIKDGLVAAYTKLSEYYYRFDQSSFYLWAACEFSAVSSFQNLSDDWDTIFLVLDPCISYKHLKEDFAKDHTLLQDLENVKAKLYTYFNKNYISRNGAITSKAHPGKHDTMEGCSNEASSMTNFMACYRRRETQVVDELKEYFKLAPEDFDTCDPFKWWHAQHSNQVGWDLHCLALDILCIPGMFIFFCCRKSLLTSMPASAVVVEYIFSGGQDTISLCWESLKPDVIRSLIVLKHHLLLKQNSVIELDWRNVDSLLLLKVHYGRVQLPYLIVEVT